MSGSEHQAPPDPARAAFAAVLAHLTPPIDAARVVAALLGLSPRSARHVAGVALAASPEADRLLRAMPQIVRSMAIATTDRPERCFGELRGPVLWAETVSARAASAGDPGLFVCATTKRAYDTGENRILKAALAAIAAAGVAVETGSALADGTADAVRRARANGHAAAHLLEHRTLTDVPVTRVRARMLHRTRGGSRRSTYEPAVALVRRSLQPLTADLLAEAADAATAAQVGVLAAVLDAWPPVAGRPALRTAHGALVAGPVRYVHGEGVTVGGVAVRDRDEGPSAVARVIHPNRSSGPSPT